MKKKKMWTTILKILATVATALLSAIGGASL
ncbi:MAG: smalltalk protein [Paraprevotella sp.]|nr:smalltalk protein [Paraprevotella sp.]